MSEIKKHSSELPLVVIVGRPNVGKSTLFNRLIRKRVAIVDDQPGVTRDRLYRPTTWNGKSFLLTDTGGFFGPDEDPLSPGVQEQIEEAAKYAEVLCMVVDGSEGPTGLDQDTADRIRRLSKGRKGKEIKVVVAVNKCDNPSVDYSTAFYELGFKDVVPVSAIHGYGTGNLLDLLVAPLPLSELPDEEDDIPGIALLGRPNVGKSTLLNALCGEKRSLVSTIPGTTRDPVDTLIEWEGKLFRIIDTAGIRRRGKMSQGLDRYSLMRGKAALARANAALLLIDGSEGPTESDAKVFSIAHDMGRAAVLLVNKWDAVEKDTQTAGATVKKIREMMPWLNYAEVQLISALSGQRLQRIFPCIEQALENHKRRIPTAELNRALETFIAKKPPPSRHGRIANIYYWTQANSTPPTFILFVNDPERIHFSYQRYLINQLYETFDFQGTPLRLIVRARRSRDVERPRRKQSDFDAAESETLMEDWDE